MVFVNDYDSHCYYHCCSDVCTVYSVGDVAIVRRIHSVSLFVCFFVSSSSMIVVIVEVASSSLLMLLFLAFSIAIMQEIHLCSARGLVLRVLEARKRQSGDSRAYVLN